MTSADTTARVKAPASKSMSHRYLIGAALAPGRSTVRHVLESADLIRTRAILQAAGAQINALPADGPAAEDGPDSWQVTGLPHGPRGGLGGQAGLASEALDCDVEESGTTCRLLTAVLAAGQGCFRIHGAGRMHERPIGELVRALTALGADVVYEGKPLCPPLLLTASGLNPALCNNTVGISMDASSQYFSGLLLAAPLGPAPLTVVLGGQKAVSWPYVGLTLQCLTDFGITFQVESRTSEDTPWQSLSGAAWRLLDEARPGCLRVTVQPGPYQAGHYTVEGDWSGASYLLAAGALGRRPVRVEGLRPDSLQGDRAMLHILEKMGTRYALEKSAVTVYPSPLHGVDLDMGHCPDLVPTVAVLASFAQGSTRISNVAHLRIKESDRIKAPATELAKAGVTVDELADGLLVHGLAGRGSGKADAPHLPEGTMLSTHNDHRMAMSLALLGLRDPGLHMQARLDAPAVVRKSFPRFWDVWSRIA